MTETRVTTDRRRARAIIFGVTMLIVTLVSWRACREPRESDDRQALCDRDSDTRLIACLVKAGPKANQNKQLGGHDCYWELDADQPLRDVANGLPKNFVFQVLNFCDDKVTVTLSLPAGASASDTLDFAASTASCGIPGVDGSITLPDVDAEGKTVLCTTLPYAVDRTRERRRSFELKAIAYGAELVSVTFDPEVVLEKAGEP